MAALFRGRGVELTSSTAFWSGDFRPVEEIPPPIRHALGYAAFVDHVTASGEDPTMLADDVEALVGHLRRHRGALLAGGGPLLDSAGVFLGNSLIERVADTRWQVVRADEPEVSQGRPLSGGAVVLRMVRLIVTVEDDRMREFWTFLRRWDGHDAEADDIERGLALVHLMQVPSIPYLRPAGADLVGVLDALVDHLTTHYRASATETASLPSDPRTDSPTARTIRLTPAAIDAAPLVIAVDVLGAVAVRAGALQEFAFYRPGTDELEATLLAVAAGAYREAYPIGADDFAGYHLGSVDAVTESSGYGLIGALDPELRAAAAAQLAELPDGWKPWDLRVPPAS